MPYSTREKVRSILKLHKADENARSSLRASAISDANSDVSFLFLVLTSSAIATFGLLENSVAAIIGAMIIAPLIRPIRAMAYGAAEGSFSIFARAVGALTLGTLFAILLSAGIGSVVHFAQFGSEVLSRSQPTLLDLAIAIIAGFVAGFAAIRPGIADSIAGTAIAVALMPPLCVVGLAIAHGNIHLESGAILLFATNLLGISLACMLLFLVTGYVDFHRARATLFGMLVLTIALSVPLAQSLKVLIHEANLEVSLRNILADTRTFRRAELASAHVDWQISPPHVTLSVRSDTPVSPHQVQLLEEYVQRSTGQRFRLTLRVTLVHRVDDIAPSPNPHQSLPSTFLDHDSP